MITIRQLADELGMTKQGIRKYLNQLPQEFVQKNDKGIIEISSIAADKIKGMVEEKRKPVTSNEPVTKPVTEPHVTGEVTTLISMLQRELDGKNAQIESQAKVIESQNRQLEVLTAALGRQQALHAGTIQQQLTEGEGSGYLHEVQTPPLEEKRPNLWQRLFGK